LAERVTETMQWDRVNKRRALIWGAWGVVLVAGLTGLFGWHSIRSYEAARREFETHVGSADHRDYVRAPVADDQNAAQAFKRAAAGVEIGREWFRPQEPVAWPSDTGAAARAVIASNREALTELRAAADLPSCVWPSTLNEPASFRPVMGAARLVRLDGFVGVFDVEQDRIEASFDLLGELADCLYAQPHIFGSLLAVQIERMQLEVIHAALSSPATGTLLVEHFGVELEAKTRVDRVRWAVAAEGAYALRLLEERQPGWLARQLGVRSPSSRGVGRALALRWVEFAAWSSRPLEELVHDTEPEVETGFSVAALVADIAISGMRHAIVNLRTNQALAALAQVAVEGRLQGHDQGSYDGVFEDRADFNVLKEGDGSVVLLDAKLAALVQAHLESSSQGGRSSAESTLDLTVWRLPPPSGAPRR